MLAANCKLSAWDQCGGKSNCKTGSCGDAPWPGQCCAGGATCMRNNEYYFNCQPAGSQAARQAAPGSSGSTAAAPAPAAAAPAPAPAVPARKVNGEYDYAQVLGLSMMFYEAQRSGKLPASNRIKWRGDSGLTDRAPDGRDVTGGWYDAGDNVKFNLPMAWAAGVLAWSAVEFAEGYRKAGQLDEVLANIKWVTDYFIKCVGDGTGDIVVQVGNGAQDHAIWGRPEDVAGPVPVYTVSASKPGSDAVGAMAGALAAASVAFAKSDAAYSRRLLDSAVKAYTFASKHLGSYSASVADAASFYRFNNYRDDLSWAAAWLHVRTGDAAYKAASLSWFRQHWAAEDGGGVWNNYDWDSNSWGAVVLLNRFFPGNAQIAGRIAGFVSEWTRGGSLVQYTPKGLAYSGPWGSLRHVGNALFLMKAFTSRLPSSPKNDALKREVDCTLRRQLGYILGDAGRSFVVGFGANPPARPHHRASSCPPLGAACSWDAFNSHAPNPHTLFGALVGGPGGDDSYVDDRGDYIKNEVATDYNAGLSGALAAAVQGLARCSSGGRKLQAAL